MHPAFAETDHRPWPVPTGPWTWRQVWHDLLFAHWPVSAAVLRPLVPRELTVQEFSGVSWVAVIPFHMTGVMRRPWPDLPGVSAFPELNVRVYVERDGKPGIWFLSLDATNRLAIWAARRWWHLPYVRARMSHQQTGERHRYRSERAPRKARGRFSADFTPIAPLAPARPGTLEHFLVERYCLYARAPNGVFFRGEVHHVPWPLQPAAGAVDAGQLLAVHGIQVSGPPLLHFAKRVDVVLWPLERLGRLDEDRKL
ncbi:MAG: DUF2071 domain-containing protein [Planctomycetes bacterium]|nr:DUF2071 domain-containing protein [Planctomycetota bacterium]